MRRENKVTADKKKALYIGLMSGTSMDAVDAVLVNFDNAHPTLLASSTTEIPTDIKNNLCKLIQSQLCDIRLLGETDTALGKLFAKASLELINKCNIDKNQIIAIGSHGQTIYHHPACNNPFTMQIGDPNIIAAITQITTVADFRRKDMALGGQAAPLVPAFHNHLFADRDHDSYIVNIGGIANVTYLLAENTKPIIGFDIGPGNTLLDQWHQKHRKLSIDLNGDWARSGKINKALLTRLLADPYFRKEPPKSTGREYFNLHWLQNNMTSDTKPEDTQATLTELTAITLANAIPKKTKQNKIWICGGGAFNNFLLQRIKQHCEPASVHTTFEIGIDPKCIEAMAFAWLAKQTIEKKPGNLISVTGASKQSILGGIFYS